MQQKSTKQIFHNTAIEMKIVVIQYTPVYPVSEGTGILCRINRSTG